MCVAGSGGPGPGDQYWGSPRKSPCEHAVKARCKNLKLGRIATSKLGDVDPEVADAFESACAAMAEMGHRVDPIDLDPGAMLVECARILICVGVAAIPVTNPECIHPVLPPIHDFRPNPTPPTS